MIRRILVTATIHHTAIVEDGAELGADCTICAHAIITRHARLGAGVIVHPGAVIGADPQDLKFDPATASGVRIGQGTVLRENVTVNRSTVAGGETIVGANCFVMAGAHVGHDCVVGDHVVLANNVLLAGHVRIGAHAFIGGGAAFHQFTRVGESAMVGGLARITLDIPPYVLAAERDEVVGLNLVGLKRRNLSREVVAELKDCFREVYFDGGNVRHRAQELLARGGQSAEVTGFLQFFAGGRRGIARARRVWSAEPETSGDAA
jgi:UDP-N-acetylglucosamine acyltransferase